MLSASISGSLGQWPLLDLKSLGRNMPVWSWTKASGDCQVSTWIPCGEWTIITKVSWQLCADSTHVTGLKIYLLFLPIGWHLNWLFSHREQQFFLNAVFKTPWSSYYNLHFFVLVSAHHRVNLDNDDIWWLTRDVNGDHLAGKWCWWQLWLFLHVPPVHHASVSWPPTVPEPVASLLVLNTHEYECNTIWGDTRDNSCSFQPPPLQPYPTTTKVVCPGPGHLTSDIPQSNRHHSMSVVSFL